MFDVVDDDETFAVRTPLDCHASATYKLDFPSVCASSPRALEELEKFVYVIMQKPEKVSIVSL